MLTRGFASAGLMLAAAISLSSAPTSALPAAPAPTVSKTAMPSPIPSGARSLPLGSSLFFVLDDRLSSKTNRTGDVVRAHLRDALILNGVTVAAAGAPLFIKITDLHGAQAPDKDGSVDIDLEPFVLSNHDVLPLHAPTSHLSVRTSAGQVTTATITDEVKDIFIPYHYLYRFFRKGAQLQLDPGTVLRARTAATVATAQDGALRVTAAPPVNTSIDPVHSDYKPMPFATVAPSRQPPSTVAPAPTPSPVPSGDPGATPAPVSSPSLTGWHP